MNRGEGGLVEHWTATSPDDVGQVVACHAEHDDAKNPGVGGAAKKQEIGEIAQLVEHWTENPGVGGSSPPLATSLRSQRSGERRLPRRSEATEGSGNEAGHTFRCELRLGTPARWLLMNLYYVYILETETIPRHYYVGFTEEIEERVDRHNAGRCPHTAKRGPWRMKTYIAFSDRERAIAFERYLKTSSGRAFSKKRL